MPRLEDGRQQETKCFLEDRNDEARGGHQQGTHDADQQQKKNELEVYTSHAQ